MNEGQVSAALARSFVSSHFGLALSERFPAGTMDRVSLMRAIEWQKKYAPVYKRRIPKKRRRK